MQTQREGYDIIGRVGGRQTCLIGSISKQKDEGRSDRQEEDKMEVYREEVEREKERESS